MHEMFEQIIGYYIFKRIEHRTINISNVNNLRIDIDGTSEAVEKYKYEVR